MTSSNSEGAKALSQPFTLPCGRTAPNRLVKAPMEEMMGSFSVGLPNEKLFKIYKQWAKGGWGIIITGNIAIDSTHLGTPFDIRLPSKSNFLKDDQTIQSFKKYAQSIKGELGDESPLAIVQLVHAGRQSMRGLKRSLWQPALAPSSIPMSTSKGITGKLIDYALWNTPKEMTKQEVKQLIDRFVEGSVLSYQSGFDGVEIHASHGYQIAAFLSPRTNIRKDEYGGNAKNRARLLMEIIDGVRQRVPKSFAVGVKLNSSDYVQGGLTEEDALMNVKWLAEHGGVDFVEISGGNYENPSFMMDSFDSEKELAKINGSAKKQSSSAPTKGSSARTQAREAFFQNFALRARTAVQDVNGPGREMALILTGGLRSRSGMAGPVVDGIVDGVGIGRMACVYPDLPKTILDVTVPDNDAKSSPPKYTMRGSGTVALLPLKIINAGWGTLWHVGMLSYLSRDQKPNVNATPFEIISSVFFPDGLHSASIPFVAFSAVAAAISAFVLLARG